MINMFNVYRVVTWDDVSYTKEASFEKREDAENEAKRLNDEFVDRPWNIRYCVMSDVEYHWLMYRDEYEINNQPY